MKTKERLLDANPCVVENPEICRKLEILAAAIFVVVVVVNMIAFVQ